MNIANPFKLLLVSAAMFAGFSLRADGTLPLPLTQEELPFQMSGSGLEKSTSASGGSSTKTLDLSLTLDSADSSANLASKLQARCRATESFHDATGSIQVDDELFDIQGVCAPKTAQSAAGARQIIASNSGRILQFDGSFAVAAAKKSFAGKVLTIDSVTSTPETGDTSTKTITFTLTSVGSDDSSADASPSASTGSGHAGISLSAPISSVTSGPAVIGHSPAE